MTTIKKHLFRAFEKNSFVFEVPGEIPKLELRTEKKGELGKMLTEAGDAAAAQKLATEKENAKFDKLIKDLDKKTKALEGLDPTGTETKQLRVRVDAKKATWEAAQNGLLDNFNQNQKAHELDVRNMNKDLERLTAQAGLEKSKKIGNALADAFGALVGKAPDGSVLASKNKPLNLDADKAAPPKKPLSPEQLALAKEMKAAKVTGEERGKLREFIRNAQKDAKLDGNRLTGKDIIAKKREWLKTLDQLRNAPKKTEGAVEGNRQAARSNDKVHDDYDASTKEHHEGSKPAEAVEDTLSAAIPDSQKIIQQKAEIDALKPEKTEAESAVSSAQAALLAAQSEVTLRENDPNPDDALIRAARAAYFDTQAVLDGAQKILDGIVKRENIIMDRQTTLAAISGHNETAKPLRAKRKATRLAMEAKGNAATESRKLARKARADEVLAQREQKNLEYDIRGAKNPAPGYKETDDERAMPHAETGQQFPNAQPNQTPNTPPSTPPPAPTGGPTLTQTAPPAANPGMASNNP